ncbi:hypothetical protein THRCLA_11524 [Thraustotheca clavata]|uniref:peptidylprolyl isomerase n=1 Tax=Thraustotheca clavata TaxID=74557 RepID=A0A1V9Y7M6_9STRA|nr:hypothetical protein THRCLA_11524 [Thraustotheca clavata]
MPKNTQKTLEPGYLGEVIAPGHTLVLENPTGELALQLSTAALDHKAGNGRTTLYIATERNSTKIAACTLDTDKCPQWNVNQTFSPMDGEVSLSVEGANSIHLTGYVDAEMDDEMDDEDQGMYGSDDEDMLDIEEEADSEEEEDQIEDSGRFEIVEEKSASPANKKKENTPEKKEVKKDSTPEKKNTPEKNAEKKESTSENKKNDKKRAAENDAKDAKKQKTLKMLKGGVTVDELVIGKGKPAQKGRKVQICYKGTLAKNGKQFDANLNRKSPFAFRLGVGDVIPGFDIGVEGMRVGGKRIVNIPSKMGYGKAGAGRDIPPNSDLVFEIELINA